ncbi:hypothetical protein [Nakamurella sp. UYEF19]|uniref:hypothetical protein n=1 Tax=Nakamurella sp. UYEF19 TaxID=1756392 RepID=UPI0033943B81
MLPAAGPPATGDQPGAHRMAILAVPADEVAQYGRRATAEDQSVVRALLDVDTVTWDIRFGRWVPQPV